MNITAPWPIAESTIPAVLANDPRPLESLAAGEIPAIVLRGHVPASDCSELVGRCIEQQLLYDPDNPESRELDAVSIPEGHFTEGTNTASSRAWGREGETRERASRRIDIGTSLGYRGSNQEEYFDHSSRTLQLFGKLFDGMTNLVQVVYSALEKLSVDKHVKTAEEKDGRKYGPAIIRAHYGGYSYQPHFDSVRNRENRTNYSVYDFAHQFAGVLVLQNAEEKGVTPHTRIHRCFWEPEITPHLQSNTFPSYARDNGIEWCDVTLQPGDLYFFNTGCIHEVPGIDGKDARIVLAVFTGYSRDRDEIHVWS